MVDKIQYLEMKHITKSFPGVLALDDVSIELKEGEILALLGENGAGKTTLMNVLYGLYHQDEGIIRINDKEINIESPKYALTNRIGMVHQHFMLVPNLTVLENVALGYFQNTRIKLDLELVRSKMLDIANKYGMTVNPDAYIWQLSVGEQQRVELVKTLTLGANLLILDEPTAALTPQQTDELIELLKEMAMQNNSIIFISHKLNEVKSVSDRIAVLRNGKLVHEGATESYSVSELAEEMAGRQITLPKSPEKSSFGEVMLDIKKVWAFNDQGTWGLKGLSLELRAGEIMGIAGVSGNGQRELADVINGVRKVEKGNILIDNWNITNHPASKIIEQGMGYIPEDRLHEGSLPGFSVRENLILKDYASKEISTSIFLKKKVIDKFSRKLIDSFNIKCPGMNTSCASLSGGNIQKVILAREITRSPKVLIAAYPIRGLDIGAAEYVHNRLIEAREAGMAVLLISEELEEIIDLSDRIAVIYEGEILKIMSGRETDNRKLGLLMAGVTDDD
jgi:general nucleoside transport system ATP-binding protein